MKYSVDRIEENICILENLESRDIIEIELECLPNEIKEGNILIYQNEEFIILSDEEKNRRLSLRERMNKLKKVNNHGE